MGRWVTLESDQRVYISDGGKVLATRGAISATAGGRERMGAMRAKAGGATQRALAKAREAGKQRASEHAKTTAAGPGQAREMARSQFTIAEKIRSGKMADAAMKASYARQDALKAKLGAPTAVATKPTAARSGEATVGTGKMVFQGHTKEGLAKYGPEGGRPESSAGESIPNRTARAIEHAKAAGPAAERQRVKDEHEKLFPGLAAKARMTVKQQAENLADHKRQMKRAAGIRGLTVEQMHAAVKPGRSRSR
ncbi:MAG TPA: hypothetical protein VKF17_16770 [Isosphaeraceae bacterium]|nr:hypothetical protein [Isosphaeraceae bacterium]